MTVKGRDGSLWWLDRDSGRAALLKAGDGARKTPKVAKGGRCRG